MRSDIFTFTMVYSFYFRLFPLMNEIVNHNYKFKFPVCYYTIANKQERTQRRIYKMKIKVLHQGDKVLNVTSEFIVIKRVNGEVDIIPIVVTDMGPRVGYLL